MLNIFRRSLYRILLPALLAAVPAVLPAWAAESEPAPLAERGLLLDGQAAGSSLVAVGERGHILVSADDGRTWRQSRVPTRVTLTSVFFADGQLGWAAGHDATILRTRDGGVTWQIVHTDPDLDAPILDLWFRDARYGLAIGAYGLCLLTTDGGDSWEKLAVSTTTDASAAGGEAADAGGAGFDLHLNQLQADAGGRLYLAGESGHLFHSADGGRHWQQISVPYAGSLFGTLPLAGEQLLAYGLRGHLLASRDGGRSWQTVALATQATLNDALRLPDGRIIVVGLEGTVLTCAADAGRCDLHPQPDRAGFTRVLPSRDGALVLLGSQGARRLAVPAAGETR